MDLNVEDIDIVNITSINNDGIGIDTFNENNIK